MAFFTRNFLMCALEFESAIAIVHEQKLAPRCRSMAAVAADFVFSAKLAAMNICVAIHTTKSQRTIAYKAGERFGICRLATRHRFGVLAQVTFRARHFLMHAHQRKTRGIVIEFRFVPAFIFMANRAISFCQALGKLPGVDILMACLTTLIRKNKKQFVRELSCPLPRMTLAARRRKMRAQ
jgi:hypothetical protein